MGPYEAAHNGSAHKPTNGPAHKAAHKAASHAIPDANTDQEANAPPHRPANKEADTHPYAAAADPHHANADTATFNVSTDP